MWVIDHERGNFKSINSPPKFFAKNKTLFCFFLNKFPKIIPPHNRHRDCFLPDGRHFLPFWINRYCLRPSLPWKRYISRPQLKDRFDAANKNNISSFPYKFDNFGLLYTWNGPIVTPILVFSNKKAKNTGSRKNKIKKNSKIAGLVLSSLILPKNKLLSNIISIMKMQLEFKSIWLFYLEAVTWTVRDRAGFKFSSIWCYHRTNHS